MKKHLLAQRQTIIFIPTDKPSEPIRSERLQRTIDRWWRDGQPNPQSNRNLCGGHHVQVVESGRPSA